MCVLICGLLLGTLGLKTVSPLRNYIECSSDLFPLGMKQLSPIILVSLDHHNKIPQSGLLKQKTFLSHSSGHWEVQDQGPGIFGV